MPFPTAIRSGWRRRPLIALVLLALAGGAAAVKAADHRDSTLLAADKAADIADVYVFRSPANPSNLVLVMTVAGLTPPAEVATTFFDPDVLYQWKIDNSATLDAVEDLVIQAYVTGSGPNQRIHFRGPRTPVASGASSQIIDAPEVSVPISLGAAPTTASRDGMTVFAGSRDDPFFFDLAQFLQIVGGQASSFRDPGVDTFAGTNVLALVVELPAARLGGTPTIAVWGTTSR